MGYNITTSSTKYSANNAGGGGYSAENATAEGYSAKDVVTNWILRDGTWRDLGIWIDNEIWRDS